MEPLPQSTPLCCTCPGAAAGTCRRFVYPTKVPRPTRSWLLQGGHHTVRGHQTMVKKLDGSLLTLILKRCSTCWSIRSSSLCNRLVNNAPARCRWQFSRSGGIKALCGPARNEV